MAVQALEGRATSVSSYSETHMRHGSNWRHRLNWKAMTRWLVIYSPRVERRENHANFCYLFGVIWIWAGRCKKVTLRLHGASYVPYTVIRVGNLLAHYVSHYVYIQKLKRLHKQRIVPLSLLYLTNSFLMGNMEVRYSLLYYVLLVS